MRYATIKPLNSRWRDGWLISLTTIEGYEVVRYLDEQPFVMTRSDWDALPEYRTGTGENHQRVFVIW